MTADYNHRLYFVTEVKKDLNHLWLELPNKVPGEQPNNFKNLNSRLCGQELEIINNLIKGHKRPLQQQNDVTFSLYEQIEQGFYKCHDSIYDVPEGQRIPDLMKKRPATNATKAKVATEKVSFPR